MQKLANLLVQLSRADEKDRIIKHEGEELIKVNIMTSAIAFMYEKLRTVVDYKEDHLLRKGAIFRILKRRFLEGDDYYKIAENVIKELISARYLENNKMPENKIIEVAQVIEKYDLLHSGVREQKGFKAALDLYDWIVGLAAVEIEEVLVPANKENVFVRFMYDEVKSRIEIVSQGMDEEEKNLQIFIAVNRSLVKSDRLMLEYLLLKLWYPEWRNDYKLFLPKFIDQIFAIQEEINKQINHKMAFRLLQFCRRYATMVIILHEVIEQDFKNAPALMDNPQLLEAKIREMCQHKYVETRRRLRTQIWRAIIYVFITKMLLALIIEIPFDYYLFNTFRWFAIIINITFPPLLMILIATTIRTPSEKNTQAMIKGIQDILSGNIGEIQYIKEPKHRNWFTWTLFHLVYVITFLIPFVLIIYILNKIHFSFLSIILFLAFLSIVSFFGVRIRNSARELVVIKSKENIANELYDFLTLPFIRLGRWLSFNFQKVNIFVFIFDFMIEAPLKIILQAVEEWLAFFKEKKEDLE